MQTHNEAIQQYVSEGLKSARASGIPKPFWPDHCAAYLAAKLADSQAENVSARRFHVDNPARLKHWIGGNSDLFYATLADLDLKTIAGMTGQPAALGAYLLKELAGEMNYQEPWDMERDHGAEEDMRQRAREAKADEKDWLGVG